MRSRRQRKKPTFFFNPKNPSKSYDVYIDKDPSDTIPIKYTTVEDVKQTIRKLERLYRQRKYPHKRIWQVAMIMKVRLRVLRSKKPEQYRLASEYLSFLSSRTKASQEQRFRMTFRSRKMKTN